METQRLLEIGEKLGLAGKELRDFIHSEQEAARAERQIEREATREDAIRVAAAEEAERVATREDAIRVAAAEEAARNIAREEIARQHERDMFKMQLEADQLQEREANLFNSRADNTRGVRMQGHTPMMPGFRDDGKEDIDVYIQRFERFAHNQGWDPEGYATYLGSLLSGEALLVYHRIPAPDAHNYDVLKQALLKRYSKTPDDFRKKFYGGRQSVDENAPQFICRLEHWLAQWISLSKIDETFDGLRELILQGQFLHACSPDLAVFIKEHMPCHLERRRWWNGLKSLRFPDRTLAGKRLTGKRVKWLDKIPLHHRFQLSDDFRVLTGQTHLQSDVSYARRVGTWRINAQQVETDHRCNVNRRSYNTDR